eukprot:792024-Pyramimonas_sp.AAC.1
MERRICTVVASVVQGKHADEFFDVVRPRSVEGEEADSSPFDPENPLHRKLEVKPSSGVELFDGAVCVA